MKHVYVVMELVPWTEIEVHTLAGFSLSVAGKPVKNDADIPGLGFFPAFATRERAERYADGALVVKVERRKEDGS